MCLVRNSQTLKNICVSEDKIGMCPIRQCQDGRQRVKRPKRKWHQHHPRPTEEFATWILVLKHVGTMDHMDAFVMTHQHPVCVCIRKIPRDQCQMAVCQNLVPLVNIKIAGKWMFIPLKIVLIGIDPYPI